MVMSELVTLESLKASVLFKQTVKEGLFFLRNSSFPCQNSGATRKSERLTQYSLHETYPLEELHRRSLLYMIVVHVRPLIM